MTTSLVRKARQMTISRNAYKPEQVMNKLVLKISVDYNASLSFRQTNLFPPQKREIYVDVLITDYFWGIHNFVIIFEKQEHNCWICGL